MAPRAGRPAGYAVFDGGRQVIDAIPEGRTTMNNLLAKSCLAMPIALVLTSTVASAQYYRPRAVYPYYSPPAAYRYYSAPAQYYSPPMAYYGPSVPYYSEDPVKRFWARQERYTLR
jgi:hypothetical protein